jgi:hypothetical protein
VKHRSHVNGWHIGWLVLTRGSVCHGFVGSGHRSRGRIDGATSGPSHTLMIGLLIIQLFKEEVLSQ